MTDKRFSVIEQLHTQRSQPVKPVETSDDNEYRAFTEERSRRAGRLRINFSDGSVTIFSYGYLLEVNSTSHQYLSLCFSTAVVNVKGRHLTKLLDLLLDDRIRELHPFRPDRHPEPEAGEPVITQIVLQED
jgi:hypothetical protein